MQTDKTTHAANTSDQKDNPIDNIDEEVTNEQEITAERAAITFDKPAIEQAAPEEKPAAAPDAQIPEQEASEEQSADVSSEPPVEQDTLEKKPEGVSSEPPAGQSVSEEKSRVAEPPVEQTVTAQEKAPQQTWRAFIEPWWRAMLAVLPTFLVTRFILVLLAYFGGVLFFVPNYWPGKIPLHDIIYDWNRWDAIRFATIATHGYPSLDYAAFFPLFPALAHAFSALTHRDILQSTMFISNVAFFGALIVLYRFVEKEFDREIARRTALYLSIFPTTFFFFAGYNESLFLFFVLLCFYTMRRGSWWLAGLFGFLATLTRSLGIFLALIFVCEYARQKWPELRQVWRDRQPKQALRALVHLPAVLLIPLALVLFAYALNVQFHDPLAFVHAQVSWRQGLSFPLVAPLIAVKDLLTISPFTFVNPHNIIDLSALVLFATLLVLCFFGSEKLDRSQWTIALFGVLALVYALLFPGIPSAGGLYDPMPSMQRLVLEIFIGFIMLARLGRRPWVHQTYMLFALPMLAFLVIQFITGHWTV